MNKNTPRIPVLSPSELWEYYYADIEGEKAPAIDPVFLQNTLALIERRLWDHRIYFDGAKPHRLYFGWSALQSLVHRYDSEHHLSGETSVQNCVSSSEFKHRVVVVLEEAGYMVHVGGDTMYSPSEFHLRIWPKGKGAEK